MHCARTNAIEVILRIRAHLLTLDALISQVYTILTRRKGDGLTGIDEPVESFTLIG